jgi:hypothetical protein
MLSLAAASLAFSVSPALRAAPAARSPIATQMAIVPPEFADLVTTSAPAFRPGTMMLQLVGLYTVASAAHSFYPVIKSKIETPDKGQRVINWLLSDTVPTSSFSWHHLDMRKGGLPAEVADLVEHEIGIYQGHKAYLCHLEAAKEHYMQCVNSGTRPAIELSEEFTKHFGERVFVVVKA